MVASNDFVDLIYHNRQAKSAPLRDFFSTLLGGYPKMTIWNYLYGFPIHFLRITLILYSKKLVKYLKLRLSEVYVSFGKYLIWLFDCGLRSGRERQVANIRFQQSWNLILLFVIVGRLSFSGRMTRQSTRI